MSEGGVSLPEGLVQEICERSLGSKDEVCGLLVGAPEGQVTQVTQVIWVVNVADERARRYAIDPAEYLRVEKQGRAQGWEIVGVVHSHPVGEAEPSATDLQDAWRGLSYLIFAPQARKEKLRCWRLSAVGEGMMQEDSVTVVD